MLQNLKIYEINMSTMESFKSEPQFSPFSPRKPSLFLFYAISCSITLYRTQPIKIELLSYYLTIMVPYRNMVRQIGPSESSASTNVLWLAIIVWWRELFEGGNYSRARTTRGRALFQGRGPRCANYSRARTNQGRELFGLLGYFSLTLGHVHTG